MAQEGSEPYLAPADETELASVVANAPGALAIFGGGSLDVGRPDGATGLTTRHLNGVELYEPGALTLVVGAGTPVQDITDMLAAENQRLAFEPPDLRGLLGTTGSPTIGGVVAANLSGPRRIQAGACRDFLLGVRFVDGRGRIISNGGRVMKNVTGYDLTKLMAGSWGTLGVLSQVSLKVLPQSETNATLILKGLSESQAVQALSAALASPFDVTGAAHLPGGTASTLIRLEGFEDSVHYRASALRDRLMAFGDIQIEPDPGQSTAIWRQVRDVAPFHGTPGDVWRISAKPTQGPEIAQRLGAEDLILDWGGGLIWARMAAGTDIRQRLGHLGGHATLIRTEQKDMKTFPMFHPEPQAVARLTAGIRARFDPRGILNPGLMG